MNEHTTALDLQLCEDAGSKHSLEMARAIACQHAGEMYGPGVTMVPCDIAGGRIMAEQITAESDLPRFDSAGTDGYAVCLEDLSGDGPWTLRVAGMQSAGDALTDHVKRGTGKAIALSSGAAVPSFADAVVRTDQTVREGKQLTVMARPAPCENVRRAGEAVRTGTPLLAPPMILDSRHLGLLAALGRDRIAVRRKLKVGIMSTGSELAEAGSALRATQVHDANRTMLKAGLQRKWIGLTDLGIVHDDAGALRMALKFAAENNRIVITTGGASDGPADLLAPAIESLGGQILVRGIAMDPGGSTLVGIIGETMILALPGNPVAAWIGMHVLALDVLRSAAGLPLEAVATQRGRTAYSYSASTEGVEMPLVAVHRTGTDGLAELLLERECGTTNLARLAASDGFAIIRDGHGRLTGGAEIDWVRFARCI